MVYLFIVQGRAPLEYEKKRTMLWVDPFYLGQDPLWPTPTPAPCCWPFFHLPPDWPLPGWPNPSGPTPSGPTGPGPSGPTGPNDFGIGLGPSGPFQLVPSGPPPSGGLLGGLLGGPVGFGATAFPSPSGRNRGGPCITFSFGAKPNPGSPSPFPSMPGDPR
jgi:hypothetical protein